MPGIDTAVLPAPEHSSFQDYPCRIVERPVREYLIRMIQPCRNRVLYPSQRSIVSVVLAILMIIAISPLNAESTAKSATDLPSLREMLPSISATDMAGLLSEKELLRFHPDGVSPGLLPETKLTAAVARQIIAADMNIGIEGLFVIDDLPERYYTMESADRAKVIYNILLSISTLTGLEYFSASRGEMRLLFEESWIIDGPDGKEALPDPSVNDIPHENHVYIHQKDKTFNNSESMMSFLAVDDAFAAAIVNITPMRYKGLIRVVNPENMQVHLIVVPVEEGMLIYGTMAARTLNVKAFLDRAQNSFTNRVIALKGWYTERLNEEFGT